LFYKSKDGKSKNFTGIIFVFYIQKKPRIKPELLSLKGTSKNCFGEMKLSKTEQEK